MINYTHKQSLEDLENIAKIVGDIQRTHNIDVLNIDIKPGLFVIGRRKKISLSFTHSAKSSNTTDYETHWDSLIFSILGTDAKADIIDSVDIERTTNNAMHYIKNLASDLNQQRLMAKSFQTASRDHYRKLIESEISDFFASLYQPGSPDIQDGALLQTELMKRVVTVFNNDDI